MYKSLVAYLEECGGNEAQFLDQLAFNEKLAELGRLSAGIIHELNTPLSVIVSAAQMILQERDVPEYVAEMVERISQEAQRLSQMAKGMLSFTSSDSCDEEADVNQILREVTIFLKYEAQKRAITVIEALDYHLPAISADSNRLKQIFINLIMNALHAMGNDGGYLTLKTSAVTDREIEVRIADTGPGIPPEFHSRIFEPFFTTKDSKNGTGLGLYITQKLVEALGGGIHVESEVGCGATFYVTFPLPAEPLIPD